ncbi:MAG: hypothetical protein QM796_21550 [Chthoniobacteraceae bacterium]
MKIRFTVAPIPFFPMQDSLLIQRLRDVSKDADDFLYVQHDLIEDLPSDDAHQGNVQVILDFMERYPDLDYGAPGALVHYVEQFELGYYTRALVESIQRTPTASTLTMLRRIINGTPEGEHREALINLLRSVAENEDGQIDPDIADLAEVHLEDL